MEIGGWSLDQLMELAGLSVSQAGENAIPSSNNVEPGTLTSQSTVFIRQARVRMFWLSVAQETTVGLIRPFTSLGHRTNNGFNLLPGGDGLVAARHLAHYGYKPSVYYPKQGKNELYQVSSQ